MHYGLDPKRIDQQYNRVLSTGLYGKKKEKSEGCSLGI